MSGTFFHNRIRKENIPNISVLSKGTRCFCLKIAQWLTKITQTVAQLKSVKIMWKNSPKIWATWVHNFQTFAQDGKMAQIAKSRPIWGRCYNHNFLRQNWRFFSKTCVVIKILHNLALFWVNNPNFWWHGGCQPTKCQPAECQPTECQFFECQPA
jgi:hypothetical protein